MKNNIKHLTLIISLFLLLQTAFAQKYPVAISAGKGIIVFVGKEAQQNLQYIIEKRESTQSNYNSLSVLTKPSTFVEFKSLLLHFSTMVSSININDNNVVMNAWNELNKGSSGKTSTFGNIPAVALASGLAFYDTAVKVNSTYIYKVNVINNGKNISNKESEPVKFSNQAIKNPITLHYQSADDKHIFIEWKILGLPKPANFEVYRSIVSKTDFTPVATIRGFRSAKDTLIFVVKDTLVRSNENYIYYIKASDIFGNSFETSEHVRASATSNAFDPIVLKINAISNEKNRAIELKFNIAPSPEIRALSIERSDEFDGNYTLLTNIPATDTNYFDKAAVPFKSYYYRIVINTLNGKTYPSANVSGFLSVKQYLMPPFNFQSILSPKGVELSWENSEPNITGFIVYRCEGYKGTLEQISPVISQKDLFKGNFTDSLVQAKKIYSYAVRSIDKLMTESTFSDTISVAPTKNAVPPPTPTRLKAKPSTNEIFLTWDNMYADEPLLIGYNIFRKKSGENDKNLVKLNNKLLTNQHNYYIDTTITPGTTWIYTVESIDVFNQKSGLSTIVETALLTPKPVSPTGVRLFNQDEGIMITWDEPMNNDIKEYRLYRLEGEAKPKLLGTYQLGTTSAIDKEVKTDTYYVYYLTSVSIYNIESDIINEVSIRR